MTLANQKPVEWPKGVALAEPGPDGIHHCPLRPALVAEEACFSGAAPVNPRLRALKGAEGPQ